MRYAPLVQRIDGTGAAAWDIHHAAVAAHRQGKDIIFASIGDPEFSTPAPITARAIEALKAGDTHYTDISGRPALRAAIADHLRRRASMASTSDNVVVVAGAQNGLFACSLCLVGPGDEIIIPEPAYVTYEATFSLTGATLVRVPMTAESGFRVAAEAVRAAVTPRTRAILFGNPGNPTGVVMTADELAKIAQIAIDHDLWVIADEVYSGLTFTRPHLSIAALPGMAERTATIGSLSKSHAMTGWRVGWVAGPPALIRHVDRLALNMIYGLPGFVQEAALTAFEHYDAVTEAMRQSYSARRDIVVETLKRTPGVGVLAPEAGMFVLLDTRATQIPPLDLAWAILHRTGVSVLDATAFGAAASGFLRMSFALSDDRLREACRRIDSFFRALPGSLTEDSPDAGEPDDRYGIGPA